MVIGPDFSVLQIAAELITVQRSGTVTIYSADGWDKLRPTILLLQRLPTMEKSILLVTLVKFLKMRH